MTISSATRRTEGNANHPAYVVGQGLQIVEWLQQNQAFSIIESQGPLGSMMRASVQPILPLYRPFLARPMRTFANTRLWPEPTVRSWYVAWAFGEAVPSRTPPR